MLAAIQKPKIHPCPSFLSEDFFFLSEGTFLWILWFSLFLSTPINLNSLPLQCNGELPLQRDQDFFIVMLHGTKARMSQSLEQEELHCCSLETGINERNNTNCFHRELHLENWKTEENVAMNMLWFCDFTGVNVSMQFCVSDYLIILPCEVVCRIIIRDLSKDHWRQAINREGRSGLPIDNNARTSHRTRASLRRESLVLQWITLVQNSSQPLTSSKWVPVVESMHCDCCTRFRNYVQQEYHQFVMRMLLHRIELVMRHHRFS